MLPIPKVSTEPAPTIALDTYVIMSVGIGWQSSISSGSSGASAGAGAIAEQRLSFASEPIMAASCGYHSLRVLELEIRNIN